MAALKYTDTKVVFAEVPDEITLAINISNCPCHCIGCHSSYLAQDTGSPLDWPSLNALIYINTGITCVSFMGGDANPEAVSKLAYHVKRAGLRVCWYSGRAELSKLIDLNYFDYIKVGPYDEKSGPLDSPATNQRFYRVNHENDNALVDITFRFWKQAS